jgi:ubiquinone/menaquinone biosynthesis C-methylase UbiE
MNQTSNNQAIARFDTEASARKYAGALPGTGTDRRERRCIARMLAAVPSGVAVLDLPSGAGRLLPLLCERGYRVTAADSSPHMISEGRQYAALMSLEPGQEQFVVTDVMRTPFADGAFDAVVCNRLFHHFRESHVRQEALRELHRICKGPIVVSFFRDLGWAALTFRLRCLLTRRKPTDRIPIRLAAFRKDIEAAGLSIAATVGACPLISKNWYVLLEPKRATR